jgi:hypothetical protein
MAYNTAYDLDALVVNTKAAAVYTAQENSLFMSGELIPVINLPAGSVVAQVPLMGTVVAEKLDSAGSDFTGDDFTALDVTAAKQTIEANIYAARHVMRDLGGIDPQETGRVLGNAVAKAFDIDCLTALASAGNTVVSSGDADTGEDRPLTVNDVLDAVGQIRAQGEMGEVNAVVSATAATELMKVIGTNAYGGGDFQTEVLRQGFLGSIGGARIFVSAYPSSTSKGIFFGKDAARIAMFKGLDLEIARRAEAVGNDIVANLHAGVGMIDANRATLIATGTA